MTTATTPTATYETLDAEWHAAVAARKTHDEHVARYFKTTDRNSSGGVLDVRRFAAKRAHLTRRIVKAEQAIDALRASRSDEVTAESLGFTGREILARGGRTGTKIHAAREGSSVLACGRWVKANVVHYKVSKAHRANLCERCFGPEIRG